MQRLTGANWDVFTQVSDHKLQNCESGVFKGEFLKAERPTLRKDSWQEDAIVRPLAQVAFWHAVPSHAIQQLLLKDFRAPQSLVRKICCRERPPVLAPLAISNDENIGNEPVVFQERLEEC